MGIYSKLAEIQKTLKAPKGQFNSFGKYKYRSCEDILEAIKPLAFANGAVITISDDEVLSGSRHYIKATVTLTDTETGECVVNTAYAREEESKKGMDGSQITGTSSSYARKYALNGLFCIDDTKDADTNEFTEKTEKNAPVCEMCGGTVKALKTKDGGRTVDDVLAYTQAAFKKKLCWACACELKKNDENIGK